ncbi:hypothetical protein OUZ56_014536 [Daphnia magna]|uniref:Uncharacterized protein n=1 Tax=Daphnia magna TaxID=35525 RepID=A0ABR0AK18_9CRUS|nr:hypothetical protein OUZ56_014536 [Daphnia magna]
MAISGYLTSFTKTRCIVPCVKRLSFGFIWQVSEFSRLILTLFHDSFICFADLKVARCQLDANRCGEVIEMEMSDDDIDTIVGLHNDLRRKVASGQEDLGSPGPQPTATFMPDLVWDDGSWRMPHGNGHRIANFNTIPILTICKWARILQSRSIRGSWPNQTGPTLLFILGTRRSRTWTVIAFPVSRVFRQEMDKTLAITLK